MHRNLAAVLVFVTAAAAVPAQEGFPAPAPELAKLKVFAGHWRGQGTVLMEPGKPATMWAAETTYTWVLGGHFLQADTSIRFDEGAPAIRFREFMGWDADNQRYVDVVVSNLGEGRLVPMVFTADDTVVSLLQRTRDGAPEVERAVTKFTKDRMDMTLTFLTGGGAPVDAVTGTFERVDKASPEAIEAAHAMALRAPEMAKIARMAGTYDLTGEVVMGPGAPAMKIQSRETISLLFDGSIVQATTKGTAEGIPGEYEAFGFYAWNATDGCYTALYLSNMGEVGSAQARFVGDDRLVTTTAGVRMGQPTTARGITELDADGRPVAARNHSCVGTADPMCDFRGTYTRAGKPGK